MQLEKGQVYRDRRTFARYVVVLDVRDQAHPRGLGAEHAPSALAWPLDPRQRSIPFDTLHPMNAYILCDSLPSHGDASWELVPGVRYNVGEEAAVWAP